MIRWGRSTAPRLGCRVGLKAHPARTFKAFRRRIMGNPQMSDRMKLGPTEALRAVFTGIGRIVMSADRTQERPTREGGAQRGQATASGRGPGGRRTRGQAPPASRGRSLDETGNVRLLSAEDLDD